MNGRILFLMTAATLLSNAAAQALPKLDETRSVVVGGKNIDYVGDSENPDLFYYFPTGLALARDDSGGIRFGFQHFGITAEDGQGSGGNLTFTIEPTWDKAAVAAATAEIKKTRPNASLAAIPIEKSYFDIIMTSNFSSDATYVTPPPLLDDLTIKYSQTLKDLGVSVTGISGDATQNVLESIGGSGAYGQQAFTTKLTNLGGRLSVATDGGGSSDFFGVRFRYMVKGVTPKFKASLKVKWKKSFEHFHAKFGGGYWFWRSSQVIDIQTMKQSGAIELTVLEGAVDDKADTLLNTVFESLVNARINGTGMFAPQLRPAAAGGGGGGDIGSLFGWSFNSNSSFQKLDESVEQEFIIDKSQIQHRAYNVGGSFGALCKSYPAKFMNLTEPDKPCPTADDLKKLATRSLSCWKNNKDMIDFARSQSEPVKKAIETNLIKTCGG